MSWLELESDEATDERCRIDIFFRESPAIGIRQLKLLAKAAPRDQVKAKLPVCAASAVTSTSTSPPVEPTRQCVVHVYEASMFANVVAPS